MTHQRVQVDYRLIARVRLLLADTQTALRRSYQAASETRLLLAEAERVESEARRAQSNSARGDVRS